MRTTKNFRIILAIIIIIVFILLLFVKFCYISNDYDTTPGQRTNLAKNGGVSEFYFIAKRDHISGVLFHSTKDFYIPDEKNKTIKFTISCQDSEIRTVKIEIKSLEISGEQTVSFVPLEGCANKNVIASFKANENLFSGSNLKIDNTDTNPDPKINTSPKIIYQDRLFDILKETVKMMKLEDRLFFRFFLFVVLVNVITIGFVCLIGKSKAHKKSKTNEE